MSPLRFYVVDAFTDKPFAGNPACVVPLDKPVSTADMQNIAMEMNLSETAFILKNAPAEYDLKWFTPQTQVDLCGHATLATAHIIWQKKWADQNSTLVFHTNSGKLEATFGGDGVTLNFPLVTPEKTEAPKRLYEGLNINKNVAVTRAGPDYLIEVEDENQVAGLTPDFAILKTIDMRGVIVTASSKDPEFDFVSRFFAPAFGIDEDPVTGSAHCALAPYWSAKLGKNDFTARQLSRRGGALFVSVQDGRAAITGRAVTVSEGVFA